MYPFFKGGLAEENYRLAPVYFLTQTFTIGLQNVQDFLTFL